MTRLRIPPMNFDADMSTWPVVSHLRMTRFRELPDRIETWEMEPGTGRWHMRESRTREEMEALFANYRPRLLTEADAAQALKQLEDSGLYDRATGKFEWDKPKPCQVCGRSDGEHDPTTAERRALRRLRRQAFWRGFMNPLGLRS